MDRDCIVLVSGVPRSGTSLMMQMLAAGGVELLCDDERPPDEHNPRGYFEFEPVKRTRVDAGWVDAARGKAVKVIHALVQALPRDRRYRVILMRRDLREVLASQRAMLARPAELEGPPGEERLAEIFETQLRELEAWLRSAPGFELLVVDYAALVEEPQRMAREVEAFLGGGLDRAAMAAVVDPSLRHQRAAGA